MPIAARPDEAVRPRPAASGAARRAAAPVAEQYTALDDRLGYWLRLAQMAAFEAFNDAMAPLDLTPGRLGALLLIEALVSEGRACWQETTTRGPRSGRALDTLAG